MPRLKLIGLAVILDFILGDPYSFPHPVKLMGNLINLEDRILRRPGRSPRSLRARGLGLVVFNYLVTFFSIYLLLGLIRPYNILYEIVYVYLVYTSLAAKSLAFEARKVMQALAQGLEEARYQLSFIVGRETKNLERQEIIKATIETVAENTSDGVIAPLFFTFILGPAGGLAYKMINTMDSMLGYKNEKYLDFGRYPALIDDVFNYIPARITGFLMCLVGLLRGRNGLPIMLRDRRKHKSPNAGYPEAAVAGILGIELGGNNFYNGILVEKPSLGDPIKPVAEEDIEATISIMYRTELLFLVLGFLARS